MKRYWTRGALVFALLAVVPALDAAAAPAKKSRTKKKAEPKVEPVDQKALESPKPAAPPPAPPNEEEARVEAAQRKLEAERKLSKVTPGTASRWSNHGAMVPVESTVQLTAPIPVRNQPIEGTVETPGQRLVAGDEVLSARLSFSAYHLQTKGQDVVYVSHRTPPVMPNGSTFNTIPQLAGGDRDIDFLRARATMAYQNIGGSDFAVRLDAEYRPQISGTRFTDWRVNELYASYGLTEVRNPEAPFWGVAVGRLAVREAGYAQADGGLLRFRIAEWLRAGLFGGVTGNPYGYNWNQRTTQVLSTDWITGGAFFGVETSKFIANVAGVLTYANLDNGQKDLDRVYVYLDAAYLITPELNVMLNGWLDMLPGGQLIQNLDAAISWSPTDDLSLTLGGGRFSTVTYRLSTDYSYVANGTNVYDPAATTGPVIGPDGEPLVPYDAVQMTTIYNNVRLRGAYRVIQDLEVNAKFDVLFRDSSANQAEIIAATTSTVAPSTVRFLPGVGLRYRNPDIIDANLAFTLIVDKESQADAAIEFGLGRGIAGVYLGGDVRYYFGAIGALDGGLTLSYTFPREWFPGALTLRGMFRYFRENVAVFVPIAGMAPSRDAMTNAPVGWDTIQEQDSILGFGGIEWRL